MTKPYVWIFAVSIAIGTNALADRVDRSISAEECDLDGEDDPAVEMKSLCEGMLPKEAGILADLREGQGITGQCYLKVPVVWNVYKLAMGADKVFDEKLICEDAFGFGDQIEKVIESDCALCGGDEVRCWPMYDPEASPGEGPSKTEIRMMGTFDGIGQWPIESDGDGAGSAQMLRLQLGGQLLWATSNSGTLRVGVELLQTLIFDDSSKTFPYRLTFRELEVGATKKMRRPVTGGSHRTGLQLRGGWSRMQLVYDNNFLVDPAYDFYGGVRSYQTAQGARRTGSHLPRAMLRRGLDEQVHLGASLETNNLINLHIDAAHALALIFDARFQLLGSALIAGDQPLLFERPVFPSAGTTPSKNFAMEGRQEGGLALAPAMNLGLATKTRSLSAVIGFQGIYSVVPEEVTIADHRYDHNSILYSTFFSFNWEVASLVVDWVVRDGRLRDENSSTATKYEINAVNTRVEFRAMQLATLFRKVLSKWGDSLTLYGEFLYLDSPLSGTNPLSNALSNEKEQAFTVGLFSAIPVYPLDSFQWYSGKLNARVLLDVQVTDLGSDTAFVGLVGLSVVPR